MSSVSLHTYCNLKYRSVNNNMMFKIHTPSSKILWINILILFSAIFILHLASCKYVDPSQKKLVVYKSSNIIGYDGKPIIVDYYFINSMNRLNSYAKQNNLTLFVTSSFRKVDEEVNGAIVSPAKMSNHLAGHAIDMNIEYDGSWFDSKLMRRKNMKNLPHSLQNFFNDIRRDKVLRWGGDFSIQDTVHIDDHLNKNQKAWLDRYKTVQKME